MSKCEGKKARFFDRFSERERSFEPVSLQNVFMVFTEKLIISLGIQGLGSNSNINNGTFRQEKDHRYG